jgi:hypothetical protein
MSQVLFSSVPLATCGNAAYKETIFFYILTIRQCLKCKMFGILRTEDLRDIIKCTITKHSEITYEDGYLLGCCMTFQGLTAASVKTTVFRDVEPCSLEEVYRRFIALMMEAVNISETLVNSYHTTRHNIVEGSPIRLRRHATEISRNKGYWFLSYVWLPWGRQEKYAEFFV